MKDHIGEIERTTKDYKKLTSSKMSRDDMMDAGCMLDELEWFVREERARLDELYQDEIVAWCDEDFKQWR